jgi:ABC-type phosphate transport system ATPase subunit
MPKINTDILVTAVAPANAPEEAISNWIDSALQYIADGRHLLAKALSATSLPSNRSAEIGAAHRALLAPLTSALTEMGVIAVDAPILLLDEPFAAQDVESTNRIIELLKLAASSGKTVVLVAHLPESELSWCDQIIKDF